MQRFQHSTISNSNGFIYNDHAIDNTWRPFPTMQATFISWGSSSFELIGYSLPCKFALTFYYNGGVDLFAASGIEQDATAYQRPALNVINQHHKGDVAVIHQR